MKQDVLTIQNNLQLLQESLLIHGGQLWCDDLFFFFYYYPLFFTQKVVLNVMKLQEKEKKLARCGVTGKNVLLKLLEKTQTTSAVSSDPSERNRNTRRKHTKVEETRKRCVLIFRLLGKETWEEKKVNVVNFFCGCPTSYYTRFSLAFLDEARIANGTATRVSTPHFSILRLLLCPSIFSLFSRLSISPVFFDFDCEIQKHSLYTRFSRRWETFVSGWASLFWPQRCVGTRYVSAIWGPQPLESAQTKRGSSCLQLTSQIMHEYSPFEWILD